MTRFQFRLRTLMLVVTIAAVICAVCLPALKARWERSTESEKRLKAVEELLRRDFGGLHAEPKVEKRGRAD